MNRLSITVVSFVVAAIGCSVPDGDDWERLRQGIAALPDDVMRVLRVGAANGAAQRYIDKRGWNVKIGTIECGREEGGEWTEEPIDLTTGVVMRCLITHPNWWYLDCIEDAVKKTNETWKGMSPAGSHPSCGMNMDPAWKLDSLPKDLDPEKVDIDTVAEFVASTPTPLPGMGPGGALRGLFPALCPLADHPDEIGCPEGPSGPPGQTPGDDPGGDR